MVWFKYDTKCPLFKVHWRLWEIFCIMRSRCPLCLNSISSGTCAIWEIVHEPSHLHVWFIPLIAHTRFCNASKERPFSWFVESLSFFPSSCENREQASKSETLLNAPPRGIICPLSTAGWSALWEVTVTVSVMWKGCDDADQSECLMRACKCFLMNAKMYFESEVLLKRPVVHGFYYCCAFLIQSSLWF